MCPEKILFSLLRAAVCNEAIPAEIGQACTPEMLQKIYVLAERYDLAHLAGHMLGRLNLPDSEPLKKLKQAAFTAVYRYVKLEHELERICEVLSRAEIAFMPLKGAAIRNLYPEPWMRTSCDIDILVHEEDLEKAVTQLVVELSYTTDQKKHYHDVSLFSQTGIHLELHFSIQENMPNIDAVLCRVWEHADAITEYRYVSENDFLVFHLLAHMSYHFAGGGCGIRPFLDIFLLRQRGFYDETVVRGYLSQCGIDRFYDSVRNLIGVWFEGQEHSLLTKEMEQFIFAGGTYGSKKQRIAIEQKRAGGKACYVLTRIFMPYRYLKIRYRVLEKYPVLFPVMQLYRWGEMLFCGGFKRSINEIRINGDMEQNKTDDLVGLLRRLGL